MSPVVIANFTITSLNFFSAYNHMNNTKLPDYKMANKSFVYGHCTKEEGMHKECNQRHGLWYNLKAFILLRVIVCIFYTIAMFMWLRDIYRGVIDFFAHFTRRGQQTTLLLLGLDNAGKTTLMFRLKEDRIAQMPPTGKPTCETLTYGDLTFTAYDLGGHKQARRIWKDYFVAANGIIFIVDTTDEERLMESKDELDGLLYDVDLMDVPIVVLANKIDLPGARGEADIINIFGLHDVISGKQTPRSKKEMVEKLQGRRPLEVFSCSVLKRQGYGNALKWLAAHLHE